MAATLLEMCVIEILDESDLLEKIIRELTLDIYNQMVENNVIKIH